MRTLVASDECSNSLNRGCDIGIWHRGYVRQSVSKRGRSAGTPMRDAPRPPATGGHDRLFCVARPCKWLNCRVAHIIWIAKTCHTFFALPCRNARCGRAARGPITQAVLLLDKQKRRQQSLAPCRVPTMAEYFRISKEQNSAERCALHD